MRRYILIFVFLLVISYLTFAISVSAHTWQIGTPLVPCDTPVNPNPCTRCDGFHLLKHVIDMGFLVVLPVGGTLILVYAGILYMLSAANPGLQGRARDIFTNTMYATIVIVLAWLIVNTILVNLGGSVSSQWYSFQCVNP